MEPTSLLLSGLLGLLSGGFGSISANRQNQQRARTAEAVRNQLQGVITRLRNPDYSGLNSASSRAYTRNQEAATANAAARGISGSGAAQGQANDILAAAMANLAQFKAQDQAQRESQVGQLYQSEAFATPEASSYNVGLDALLGALAGAAGGAGQTLAAQIANSEEKKKDKPKTPTATQLGLASQLLQNNPFGAVTGFPDGTPSRTSPFTNAYMSYLGLGK